MQRSIRAVSILTLLSVAMSSCGVMFGGSKFSGSIVVNQHPNAEIYINGSKVGKGSSIGLYPRKRDLTVELKQEGCESKTQTFYNTFRTGNFILSLSSWGLTGGLIDVATGASFKPDHKSYPEVERMSDKNYIFTMDYSECPVENFSTIKVQ